MIRFVTPARCELDLARHHHRLEFTGRNAVPCCELPYSLSCLR